ncbi:MAG: hypothetical protein QM831_14195 [Kofleriaceae bacterium]
MNVFVHGSKITLAPANLVGQGGEAEVYDIGNGHVLKWWKPPTHVDFDGLPDAQAAAAQRIREAPAKLRALPANLPASVVAPIALATDKKGAVVGYTMPKVSGTPLHSYGEIKWRRDHHIPGTDVVKLLLSLHDALAALHRANVVVGDCNDLNVLVDGQSVHLIDVDSYQFGGFACSMFSERFADPCCNGAVAHSTDTDWFAFAVMTLRTLLGVGPWQGVHASVPNAQRALQRISVLGDAITYPRAARPIAILPDELIGAFRTIFERDVRGVFPRQQLERLRLVACGTCGEEHARVRCPNCQTRSHVPPVITHGNLKWHHLPQRPVPSTKKLVITGDRIERTTPFGPELIGQVLAGHTHAWQGERLGVGFYRAGGYAVGFTFRPDRGRLDDRVALPKLRGQLVDAHAICADDRAWLFIQLADRGQLVTHAIVIAANTEILAADVLMDAPWLSGISGACAAGPHLFVPTDAGIVRIEAQQGAIAQTRVFAETAPLVAAGDQLTLSNGGIAVARTRDAVLLQLS